MKIARVIGTVVSTVHHPDHDDLTLLLVQPVDEHGKPVGTLLIAADAAQAGVGDYVLVLEEGKGARKVLGRKNTPLEAVAVGVIDYIATGGKQRRLAPPSATGSSTRPPPVERNRNG